MDDPLCTAYNSGRDAMFCVSTDIDCWKFDGNDIEEVASPDYRYDQGAMTHWHNQPIITGGYGYEVETFTGDGWNREEDIPSSPNGYGQVTQCTIVYSRVVKLKVGRYESALP